MLSARQRGRLIQGDQNCAINAAVDALLALESVALALVSDSAEGDEDGELLRELCEIAAIVGGGEVASTSTLQRLLGRANCGGRLFVSGQTHEACNVLTDLIAAIQQQSPQSAFAATFGPAWSLTLDSREVQSAQEALGSNASFASIISLLDSTASVEAKAVVIHLGHAVLGNGV